MVDNVSQGSHGNFTFTNIQTNHSIMVSFSALKSVASAGGGSLGSAKPLAHAPARSGSPLNVPPLASTIAWLMAVAAMIAVLVLRVMERRANSSWPATFVVRRLEISPKELRPGSQAVVGVTVNNRGQHAGSFKVNLKVDGVPKAEREVTLAGGTSDRVEFSVPATEPGSIAIDVGGLSGTITVKSA